MKKYLLDTNIVIGLWRKYQYVMDKLIQDKKIKILKEVCEELVVKERRQFRGQQVLSERFCKLLLFDMEVDRKNISEFYSLLDIKYSKRGNTYFDKNKLSENDLLLLYSCYFDDDLILVTEDKYLLNAAKVVLGEDKVLSLIMLVDSIKL
ncbi:hypothetical protein [Inconstantimicrobium mannanitabidum]|uniref:Uncharacterized protein n=1 Tax=Inconstantimicrobium mannanitabidum TaxID=1604901 RepID=A0ACB5RBN7_9CLOT|nr:hypothetical protein [Clostridium sp. TW13]GKX66644.1 hypothetical protein rsdtw13_19020 [Clostridium sp. TW13]